MRNRLLSLVWVFLLWFITLAHAQITKTNTAAVTTDSGSKLILNLVTNQVYITNSESVEIFDTSTLQSVGKFTTNYTPAGICYDSVSGRTAVPTTSIINGAIKKSVVLIEATGASSEFDIIELPSLSDCTFVGGKLYISANEQIFGGGSSAQVALVDPITKKTLATWRTNAAIGNLVQSGGYVYGTKLSLSKNPVQSIVRLETDGSITDIAFDPSFTYQQFSGLSAGPNGLLYVPGTQKLASGITTYVLAVLDAASAKTVRTIQGSFSSAPAFIAWPTSADPWFAYYNGPTGMNAINAYAGGSAFNSNVPGQLLGLAANRQADGSDVIYALRDGAIDILSATQPPMVYAVLSSGSGNGGAVTAGEIVSIYGAKLPATQPASASSLPLPNQIGGTIVNSSGAPSPLLYVSPSQINMLVPSWVSNGGATHVSFQVQGPAGSSNTFGMTLVTSAPDLFRGPNGELVVDPATNRWTTPQSLQGKVGVSYGTGFGATSPAVIAGDAAPAVEPLARVTGAVSLIVCGVQVPADQIYFVGLTPTAAGLYQLNFLVPSACGTNADQSVSIAIK